MKTSKSVGTAVVVVGALLSPACVSEPTTEAPKAALDSIDERDEGTTYNGWWQAPTLQYDCEIGVFLTHQLTRSSGDDTRGGGACFVSRTGASCSSDTTCTSQAQATWGGAAYGYCYAGECYQRPGAQSSYCALNPNRSPGTLFAYPPTVFFDGNDFALGCMTKTAGPNTACGGTEGSSYMRTVSPLYGDWNCY
jgi:hypothetical protein